MDDKLGFYYIRLSEWPDRDGSPRYDAELRFGYRSGRATGLYPFFRSSFLCLAWRSALRPAGPASSAHRHLYYSGYLVDSLRVLTDLCHWDFSGGRAGIY